MTTAKRVAAPAVAPDPLTAFAGAFGQIRARLDELRAEVERVQAEVEHEAGRPVPPAEVERRVDEALAELRRDVNGRIMVGGLVNAEGTHFAAHLASLRPTALELAAVTDPAGLRAWLLARAAEALARLPEPADAGTRHGRLAGLRAALLAVQRREADLLWAGEEQGVELEWRSDIDPRAVLGLED